MSIASGNRPTRLIVVAGMHRSGTSAVARTLNLLGCALPGGLLPPVSGDNEAGFWESRKVTDIHDRALSSAGISWDVPRPLSSAWFASMHRIRIEDEIADFLSTELLDDRPLVVKDPRICHLLPLWESAAARFDANLRCVIPFRHPIEVAASLHKRNQTPSATAMSLWFLHTAAAMHYSQGLPRVVVPYAELLAHPRTQANNLVGTLALAPYVGAESLNAVEAFISPRLHHHHAGGPDKAPQVLPDSVDSMYRTLLRFTATEQGEPGLHESLQTASAIFVAIRDLYGASESEPAFHLQRREQSAPAHPKASEAEIGQLRALVVRSRQDQVAQTTALRGIFGALSARISQLSSMSEGSTVASLGATAELAGTVTAPSLFDPAFYLAQRLPLGVPMVDARRDYETFGRAIGLSPHPLVQPCPARGTAFAGTSATQRQTTDQLPGTGLQHRTLLLFDLAFYQAQMDPAPETLEKGVLHFCTKGFQLGLRPHPLFDTKFYLQQNPDIRRGGINPLIHFLLHGEQERRDPHPLFSVSFYLDRYATQLPKGLNPLVHYLTEGSRQDFDPHPLFSSAYYRRQLAALGRTNENPLMHFLTHRADDQCDPNPFFNIGYYRLSNCGISSRGVNLLVHFVLEGARAGRKPHPLANPETIRQQLRRGQALSTELLAKSIEVSSPRGSVTLSKELLALAYATEEPLIHPPVLQSVPHDRLEETANSLDLPAPSAPEVSIIVPARNQMVLTLECLASIRAHTSRTRYEVILIDDGSDDPEFRWLAAVPGLRYLRNPESRGYLHSVRRGSEAAKGKYLVFLNNDTQVQPGWLEGLLEVFEHQPDAGVVGPKLVFPDGRLQQAGASITLSKQTRFIGFGADPERAEYSFPRKVDYCSGACLMVERSLYHRLGGFDEAYSPGYWEDVDFCFAARAAGRNSYFSPKSNVVHHLNASREETASRREWTEIAALNQTTFFSRRAGEIGDLLRVRVVAIGGLYEPSERSTTSGRDGRASLDLAPLGFDSICVPWEPWQSGDTRTAADHLRAAAARSSCIWITDMEPAAAYLRNLTEELEKQNGTPTKLDAHFRGFDREKVFRVQDNPLVVVGGGSGKDDLSSFFKDLNTVMAAWGLPTPYVVACSAIAGNLPEPEHPSLGSNAVMDTCMEGSSGRGRAMSTEGSGLGMYIRDMLATWSTPRPAKSLVRRVPSPFRYGSTDRHGGRFEGAMAVALYRAWLTTAFDDVAGFNHGQERLVFVDLTGFARPAPGNEDTIQAALETLQSVCAAHRLH